MSRKKGKWLSYLILPLFYGILGYFLCMIGAKPVIDLWSAKAHMIFTQSSPAYANEYEEEMEKIDINRDGTVKESEIKVPDSGTLYGNLLCENIELKAPLYYGDGEELLKKGIGHYEGSGMPGEGKPILISGHDNTYFANLETIKKGDVVEIKTNYGDFSYEVTHTKIAEATDSTAYPLSLKEEQLILYTCYPFGQVVGNREQRFFVYAQRKE